MSDDCALQVKDTDITHFGRGAWSWTNYTLSVKFDRKSGGFTCSFDYGENYEVTLSPSEGRLEQHMRQGIVHVTMMGDDPSYAREILQRIERNLVAARRQVHAYPNENLKTDLEVIACLQEKVTKATKLLKDSEIAAKNKKRSP